MVLSANVFSDDFDEEKSEWTKENRGIDFREAREIWSDSNAIEGPGNRVKGEDRWIKVGKVDDILWSAIFTYRANLIRIISVRPPRKDEREAYDG